MSEFLSMGGYGAYVWTAYGVTALALVLLFVWSWYGARAREAELEQVRKLSRSERQRPSTATLSAKPSAEREAPTERAPLSPGDVGSGAG